MTGNFALGVSMILLTGLVHTLLTITVLGLIHGWDESPGRPTIARAVLRVDLVILLTTTAAIAEATIWAAGFLLTGALSGFEEALYFSLITYSTLGYGDIVLPDQWRLLSSIEAANGIIMFGWSTSLLILALQRARPRIRRGDKRDGEFSKNAL
jgi:voltage-gated potassium channel Kch